MNDLFWFWLTASFALWLTASAQKSANTIEREQHAFRNLVSPILGPPAVTLETPIQFRATLYLNLATWNAWCNYHPTAVDIFGRSRFKRPLSEHTIANKNITIMYALLRTIESSPQSFGPSRLPQFRQLFRDMDLDPEDRSMNMSTPVGIGNRAGVDTGKLLAVDGWNSQGDLTSTSPFYAQFFSDHTGYVPRNSPWRIRFPFRWQPVLENNKLGFFFRQEHITPQAASALSFTMSPRDIWRRRVRSPYINRFASLRNANPTDVARLRQGAQQVFRTSAALTGRQQLLAEFFDNKLAGFASTGSVVRGIGSALRFSVLGPALDFSFDEETAFGLSSNLAGFEATTLVWKEKRRHDAIRPTGQTMRWLFGDRKFRVWGGPGKAPVFISAGEWLPLIRTMPHSEFPSGSACLCSAMIEHDLVVSKNRDLFPYNFTIKKGSSNFFPGQVPSEDTTISINRLTEWARLCGESRLYAGVHFEPAIRAGSDLCRGVGTSSKRFVDGLLRGKADMRWMKWLSPSAERFWEQ